MRLSVVIPVYNEAKAITHNLKIILAELDKINCRDLQIVVIDDGSEDETAEKVYTQCVENSKMELISFNRNFGKEAALYAGLNYASGDAVVVIDSDLQHPPSLIPDMIELWKKGAMVVDATKSSRGHESKLSKFLSKTFYYLFKKMTSLDIENQSDFKLLDRAVVDEYCHLPERKRFFRAIIPYLGFPTEKVLFEVHERQIGQSSWSRFVLFKYAISALSNFTSAPLHIVSLMGILFFFSSIILGGLTLYHKLIDQALPGFTTVILLMLVTGSVIMFALGQIGIYLQHMFDEIKHRPTYIVNPKKSYLRK